MKKTENENPIKISVVVPVYNVEKYLTQCINSIIYQTIEDLEIILVNDASTDSSLSICRNFETKDKRIKVIDKPHNEGVDKARFTGIDVASGEYITFVDSDDWIDKNTLSEMYNTAIENNCDVVEISLEKVMDKFGLIKIKGPSDKKQLITSPDLFDNYFISYFGMNILFVNMCGHLYKREVIEKANLKPSNLPFGEDLYFNMCLFPHVKSWYLRYDLKYSYRYGGMSNHYKPTMYGNAKYLFHRKNDIIKQYNYSKATPYVYIEMRNYMLTEVKQSLFYNKKGVSEWIKSELNDPLWSTFKDMFKDSDHEIDKAIINNDISVIINYVERQLKKDKYKYKMRLFASNLFDTLYLR